MRSIVGVALPAALLAFAWPALAQPAPSQPAPSQPAKAPYMDRRYQTELSTGAPPEGAPVPADVPRGPGSLAGTWFNADLSPDPTDHDPVRTAEGDPVPLQTWALKVMVTRAADEEDGHPYADSSSRCLPLGIPQMMLEPRQSGIRIFEDPAAVTMVFEEFNHWRQVLIGAPHRDGPVATFMGDSVGRWDGDVFVVETTNIDTDQDVQGFPHTEALRIVERYRRISADRLELKVSIDDPGTFTRPWSLPRRTLKLDNGARLSENLCTNQRNGPDATGHTSVQKPPARK
jgi:hypothetical protein